MADIVLVQPIFGHWDAVRTKPTLPLGLLSAVSLAVREFDVVIVDQRLHKNWREMLAKELEKSPIMVGITSLTGNQIKHGLDISRFVKSRCNVPVIWGGIHATLTPEQTINHPLVDGIVVGEGEETLLDVANRLKSGDSLRGTHSAWFKINGEIIKNPPRDHVDLNKLPNLPYHLVKIEDYLPAEFGKPTLYIQTSRGCHMACTFCCNAKMNKMAWRPMKEKIVVDRVKQAIDQFHVGHLYIVDESFFIDVERARAIAEGFLPLGISWTITGGNVTHMRNLNDDDYKLFEKSGLRRILFGVESGSTRVLKAVKKNISLDRLLEINRLLTRYRIVPRYNFILGLPQEKDKDLRMTIDLILRLMRENPDARITALATYVPYPQTELFVDIQETGFKPPESLEEWADYGMDMKNVDLPWITKKKKKELESLYYLSFFIDRKANDFLCSTPMSVLANMYRPMARFRMKHRFYWFMLETLVGSYFQKKWDE